jgi:glyoxylase-like metal-dependent hydrolase (beta-lactamase superfamily II)
MKINELEIYLISDGIGWVDAGGAFGLVPRSSYERYLVPDAQNRVPSAFFSLLVKERDLTILVDTGLGNKLSPKEQDYWDIDRSTGGLVQNLASINVSPEDVDIVINTHLHSDHCGGNTYIDDGKAVPTYPNATYVFQRMEWADAVHPNVRTKSTYFLDNFMPLVSMGRVRMLHGDEEITPNIRCLVTPGHTRGHQSVVVTSDGWTGLFLGDLASRSFQLTRTSWVAAYDIDPLKTIETKELWQEWAARTRSWLFFMHDHKMATARLVYEDGRYALQEIEGAGSLIVNSPIEKQHLE